SIKKEWIYPKLEFTIFQPKQKLAATFSVPTPTGELRTLANSTEKSFAFLFLMIRRPPRSTHYFYCYLKDYMNYAMDNDGLRGLSKQQAFEKLLLQYQTIIVIVSVL
ncbi:1783_t:CDS:2, partial [Ambispora leptoticha]